MITFQILFDNWLAILSMVTATGALAASWRAARKTRALQVHDSALESRAAALRRELDRVTAAAANAQLQAQAHTEAQDHAHARIQARLQLLEQNYATITNRIDLAEFRSEGHSFDQAIDFARRGADPDKLAAKFGLSRGEADLVTRLHGRAERA
jgi:hypothetical protein